MKVHIQQLLAAALAEIHLEGLPKSGKQSKITVTRPTSGNHGDYTSNLALLLATGTQASASEIAHTLIAALPASGAIKQVEASAAGFINFILTHTARAAVIQSVLLQTEQYGCRNYAAGQIFIGAGAGASTSLSLNDGRCVVVADCLANLLGAVGYEVHTLHCKDDAGGQNELRRVLSIQGANDQFVAQCKIASDNRVTDQSAQFETIRVQSAQVTYPVGQGTRPAAGHPIMTFRQLLAELGPDAARFFCIMRNTRKSLAIDLEFAIQRSLPNPLYGVQYAYARICSVQRQLVQRGLPFDQASGLSAGDKLVETTEVDLLRLLLAFPDCVYSAATLRQPHRLTEYLRDLANALHTYYRVHKILVNDDTLRHARLCLLLAVKQVLKNGLILINVSAPEIL